jgi:hypothetical protein
VKTSGNRKCRVDASLILTMPKRRVTLEYKEKDSHEFNVSGNLYSVGHYVNDMEGDNIDFSSPDIINRRCGRPRQDDKTTHQWEGATPLSRIEGDTGIGKRGTATYDCPSQ